jgi:hypothetical protein
MDQLNLMIARFPGGGVDRADVTDWLVETVVEAKADPRIKDPVNSWRVSDTPITMGRNHCIEVALKQEIDFLLMIDNDMAPDYHMEGKSMYTDKKSKPFFSTSFDFLYSRRDKGLSPAVVGAPYCGPPPVENVYVFQWATNESHVPENTPQVTLEGFSREEGAKMAGITEVAALPTGLILIDMRGIREIKTPYFYYEWSDDTQSNKASTEDVTFTRDLSIAGIPQFCNWDAWAGHWKQKCVGKPIILTPDWVSESFRRTVLREYNIKGPKEELVYMQGGRVGERPEGNGSPVPGPSLPRITDVRASCPSV